MMSSTHPDNEYEALVHVIARLAERFPAVSEEDIRAMAVEEFERFDDAHVRDFVPVLVERALLERIRPSASAVA